MSEKRELSIQEKMDRRKNFLFLLLIGLVAVSILYVTLGVVHSIVGLFFTAGYLLFAPAAGG